MKQKIPNKERLQFHFKTKELEKVITFYDNRLTFPSLHHYRLGEKKMCASFKCKSPKVYFVGIFGTIDFIIEYLCNFKKKNDGTNEKGSYN